HLRALERKGMLERRVTAKRASRTLVLAERRAPGRTTRAEIPVLGRIAAGTPILAVENREDSIPLPPAWLGAQGQDPFRLPVRAPGSWREHDRRAYRRRRSRAGPTSGDGEPQRYRGRPRGRRGHCQAVRAGR